jgi:Rieske Fe-S protein
MAEIPVLQEKTGFSRRNFFKIVIGAMASICAAVLAVPLIGSFIGAGPQSRKSEWIRIAAVPSLFVGKPASVMAIEKNRDAYLREKVIRHFWAVKFPDNSIAVYSPTCPHLGCQYNWNTATGHFECPCHGSIYAVDGRVLAGPAPRPLDRLLVKIEAGEVFTRWEQFMVGIPEKIQNG